MLKLMQWLQVGVQGRHTPLKTQLWPKYRQFMIHV